MEIPSSIVRNLRKNLLEWWECCGKRDFPWRKTTDPYSVLVSEVLLRRTAARQVLPLYKDFMLKFRTIHSLARTSTVSLTRRYWSAGLAFRWSGVIAMARRLDTDFSGRIPKEKSELTSLPGIGPYIASAVRCFAFGMPDEVIDTNTVRVTGRIFDLQITDSSRRNREFANILNELVDKTHPREFNYALIDLAATICKPRDALHETCPLKAQCKTYTNLPQREGDRN